MTNIIIYRDSHGNYTGFQSRGHAGQNVYGQDIVCASISVLVINTVNSLEQFTKDCFRVEQDEELGLIKVIFEKKISKEGTLLMNSLVLGLQGVQEAYGSRYIKVSFKEV